jgi:uncharacterized SAM-binding protein YcdF (DUF218 family)
MSKFIFSPGLWFTIIALIFLWRFRFWSLKVRRLYIFSGLVLFYLLTTPFVFHYVSFFWERKFEVFDLNALPQNTKAKIVVLGSGFSHDSTLPKTALLGCSALSRIVEAVRIANVYSNAKIHTSGNSVLGKTPGAIFLRGAAIELGIKPERISMQTTPYNTRSEADVFAKNYYQDIDTVILVTSAIHMPRARKFFLNAGVKVLYAAPCDFLTFSDNEFAWHNFIPQVSYWFKIERLTKEMAGYSLNL